jgi:arylsulfatase
MRILLPLLLAGLCGARRETGPNLIFILGDDLGRCELGCYGQKKIRTPNIDRLAAEGMRFTQAYSGNAVCAPSRCVLMTGRHPGHAAIRDNREVKPEGQHPIPDGAVTVAELLKARGYATGIVGKWGLGSPGSEGDPLRQGFDFFFGYNCQRHAHNFYPAYLWRNDQKVALEGNDGKSATGKQYSHDLAEKEGLDFIRSRKDKPFFLFMAFTLPHLALQVPEDSLAEYLGQWDDPPYRGGKGYQPHPAPRAAYAAMVSRLDRSVGRVTALLKELGLEENTLVLFSSDNGPTHGGVGGSDSEFFSSAGPFRGLKGSLYEGGIRVPLIARWPGKVRAGSVSDLPCAFQDVLPTFCEISGAEVPKGTDGISILPALLGKEGQKRREHLYWEFPGYGGQQAVRWGDWKGVRQNTNKGSLEVQLYNLADDVRESKDVAAANPEVVARITKIMAEDRVPSDVFPLKPLDTPK